MDRARRAHAEKLERDQAERAKERQEAEAKSRSREALFNTPFAGVLGWGGMGWVVIGVDDGGGDVSGFWSCKRRLFRFGVKKNRIPGVCLEKMMISTFENS